MGTYSNFLQTCLLSKNQVASFASVTAKELSPGPTATLRTVIASVPLVTKVGDAMIVNTGISKKTESVKSVNAPSQELHLPTVTITRTAGVTLTARVTVEKMCKVINVTLVNLERLDSTSGTRFTVVWNVVAEDTLTTQL